MTIPNFAGHCAVGRLQLPLKGPDLIGCFAGDLSGDGKADLVVFNANDWTPVYLGRMISTGTGLQCDWSADWIGGWHLGNVDNFEPCNYQGASGKRDLFVHNTDWFGMLRSAYPWQLDQIYYRWIHNYRYGHNF